MDIGMLHHVVRFAFKFMTLLSVKIVKLLVSQISETIETR